MQTENSLLMKLLTGEPLNAEETKLALKKHKAGPHGRTEALILEAIKDFKNHDFTTDPEYTEGAEKVKVILALVKEHGCRNCADKLQLFLFAVSILSAMEDGDWGHLQEVEAEMCLYAINKAIEGGATHVMVR